MTGPSHDPEPTPGPHEQPHGEPQRAEGPPHHRQPPGTEPLTARSPLRLRAVMSSIALVSGVVAAVLFALVSARDDSTGAAVAAGICAVLALIALTDLIVITRRFRV